MDKHTPTDKVLNYADILITGVLHSQPNPFRADTRYMMHANTTTILKKKTKNSRKP